MTIHKTHTRKDLIEIIDVFEWHDVIENANDLNKEALTGLIDLQLRKIDKMKQERVYNDIACIDVLRE